MATGGGVRNDRTWIYPNFGGVNIKQTEVQNGKVLVGILSVTCMVFGVTLMVQASTLEEAKALAENKGVILAHGGNPKLVLHNSTYNLLK